MSQFTGSQFKGAMRERRATKKAEAAMRAAEPRLACEWGAGHRHNAAGASRCTQ